MVMAAKNDPMARKVNGMVVLWSSSARLAMAPATANRQL